MDKIAALLQAFGLCVGSCGLANTCNMGGVSVVPFGGLISKSVISGLFFKAGLFCLYK
jgi:hypothetical protein